MQALYPSLYPLSDWQLENLPPVFGRGVKKRNGRHLAGNPADFVNTLTGEFWVSLRMVWLKYVLFRPGQTQYFTLFSALAKVC